jgi:hypothetical protein
LQTRRINLGLAFTSLWFAACVYWAPIVSGTRVTYPAKMLAGALAAHLGTALFALSVWAKTPGTPAFRVSSRRFACLSLLRLPHSDPTVGQESASGASCLAQSGPCGPSHRRTQAQTPALLRVCRLHVYRDRGPLSARWLSSEHSRAKVGKVSFRATTSSSCTDTARRTGWEGRTAAGCS